MPYEDLPSLRATFLDGAFARPGRSNQANILVVGPALSGRTNERFNITNVSTAEREFGAASPILRAVHEALAQGADNLTVMRSGGRQGYALIEDASGGTLKITPSQRDASVLDNYALAIETVGGENRIAVYNRVREVWVYDSANILALDAGEVTVEDDLQELIEIGNFATPSTLIPLSLLLVGSFTPAVADVELLAGDDGLLATRVERYAALNSTYHVLDYKDAEILIPVDVYFDDANVADSAPSTYGEFWKGLPTLESAQDKLGFVWQFVFNGQLYTYFTDTKDFFSVSKTAATVTVNTDLVVTALKTGKGGNANTIQINASGAAGPTVLLSENVDGGLDILVTDDGTATTSTTVTAINAALGSFNLSNGVLANTLLQASGGAATVLTTVAKTNLAGGAGGHALSHEELTGDDVPAAVVARWAAGQDSELREVNFAHQLASHCYLSSTTWKDLQGIISFKAPPAYSRSALAAWVGQPPIYTDNGEQLFIASPADNGTGLFAHKLIAGRAEASNGYRAAKIKDGTTTQSYAYGGLILTKGDSLPNGRKHPYGIADNDEAVDIGGKPIDIGKHLHICYEWIVHRNGFNGGATYRGSIPGLFAGKLVTLPVFEEPIGLNGRISRAVSPLRIHSTQLNHLAKTRLIGLRNDDAFGVTFTNARTAAHPLDSDFTRASTIRSMNRLVRVIRDVARPFIGKEYSVQMIASLQLAIDGAIFAERQLKTHQGAIARIEYTQGDVILGRLKIRLRAVPPFTIQDITTELSLAADETEL